MPLPHFTRAVERARLKTSTLSGLRPCQAADILPARILRRKDRIAITGSCFSTPRVIRLFVSY